MTAPSQPPPVPPPWQRPLVAAGVGLALVSLAAARLPWAGEEPLLAFEGAEVWGHLWTWWWHGQALPGWPEGTELALGTSQWPVIDPLPALLGSLLCRGLGPALAWNLLAMAALAGAFAGGWYAARRCGGDGIVGGFVLAMAPVFTGSLVSGLSEDAALGLLAVAVALVLRPGETPSWRWALGTGLALGVLAWCGPYLAWLGAVVALVAGLFQGLRRPRSLPRWLAAGLLAALLALPPLLAQGERALSGTGHHAGVRVVQVEPLWRVNPWGAADLASFVAPGRAEIPKDAVVRLHPVYLGWMALLLAAAGGRSRWWWLLLGSLLVAPGEQLQWLGQSTGGHNLAAAALDWLPGGAQLNHHARLFLLGHLALAVLAARGARRLGRCLGRARIATGAAALVALEYALLAPLPWPLPAADATPPDFLSELEPLTSGGVVTLPLGVPGVSPQRPLLDQRAHGRSLALDPNHPGPPFWLPRSQLGAWLVVLGHDPTAAPPAQLSAASILERGFTILAVQRSLQDPVQHVLGAPQAQGDDGAAWDLRAYEIRRLSRQEELEQLATPDAAPTTATAPADMLPVEQAP